MGRAAISEINRDVWSQPTVLRWFRQYEGWSDEGERVAVGWLADEMRGAPILDIGVGAGRTTPILKAISDDYTAIDFSAPMVEVLRAKYPGIRAEHMDARDLSAFADGSFRLAVFSWNGLDAVDHNGRLQALREIHRVLQPGGAFLFSTHNKRGPGHGEKPWTLRPDDVRHPRHVARLLVHARRNIANHRRLRTLNEEHEGWSLTNAAAHNFGIVIHYVTLDYQLAELATAGFAPHPVVFDSRTGRQILTSDETQRTWWFQIIARK